MDMASATNWVKLDTDHKWTCVAAFGSNNCVALTVEGHVWMRAAGTMVQFDGCLRKVASTSDGKTWWGVNESGQLYTRRGGYAGTHVEGRGSWENVCNDTMRARDVSVAPGGRHVAVLTTDGNVYVHSPDTQHWKRLTMSSVHAARVLCTDTHVMYTDFDRDFWACDLNVVAVSWTKFSPLCGYDMASGCTAFVATDSPTFQFGVVTACHGPPHLITMYTMKRPDVLPWTCAVTPADTHPAASRTTPNIGHMSRAAHSTYGVSDAGSLYWLPAHQ